MSIMVLLVAAACWLPAGCGVIDVLIFIDSHDSSAEMIGIRNRPSAGSQTALLLQSNVQILNDGCWPMFRPMKE